MVRKKIISYISFKDGILLFYTKWVEAQNDNYKRKHRLAFTSYPLSKLELPIKSKRVKEQKEKRVMGSVNEMSDEVQVKPYWRWSKQDFFPEESFQNWGTYRHALSQTCFRFKDRLLSRSDDANEVGELRKRSENEMKRCLNWWDLTWFGFGSVVGAGIFVLTGQEANMHAGPAIVLSYAASGFSAMLSVFCYTEFAIEIPVARWIVCLSEGRTGRLCSIYNSWKLTS